MTGVKELADQIEFVFQTKIRRLEIMYLRDGQDFTDFKKQTRQYSFACLLGAKREVRDVDSNRLFDVFVE